MKRILLFLTIAIVIIAGMFAGENAQTQTFPLAGSQLNLTVVPTGSAADIQDSVTAVHTQLLEKLILLSDSTTAVHVDLLARILAVRDTTKNAHTNLLARIVTGIDSTKSAHTNLLARIVASIDTTKGAHTNLLAKVLALARADTASAIHTNLLANILALARADTVTDIHEKLSAVQVALNASRGALGILHEQADTAINITALADSETTVLNLRTASTRYALRNLILKSADPGANTVTVKLYEFVNDAFVAVDSFAITTVNYTTYFKLEDLFGVGEVYGDNLMITVQTDAGTAAITGQYSYAKTSN